MSKILSVAAWSALVIGTGVVSGIVWDTARVAWIAGWLGAGS